MFTILAVRPLLGVGRMSAAASGKGSTQKRPAHGLRGVLAGRTSRHDRGVLKGVPESPASDEGADIESAEACSVLLVRISAGDVGAFHQLFVRHRQPLMLVFLRSHREKRAAEAAHEELFTMIWTYASLFDSRCCSGTRWIYGLARGEFTVRG